MYPHSHNICFCEEIRKKINTSCRIFTVNTVDLDGTAYADLNDIVHMS